MDTLSDEELVQRFRAEPATSQGLSYLNSLFERHHARVASWCHGITGDTSSAADLAQEVFLKAYQHLDSFRGSAKFTTWLYSIARNQCLDELRSRAKRPAETTEVFLEQMVDSRSEDVSLAVELRESQQMLRELMRESLDETEAVVMTLHYVEEMPLDSITRLLRLTNPSGAKAYIVSAKRKLNRDYAKWRDRKPLTRE